MTTITDELFSPGITHIEIRCWDCGHTVVRKPDQVPAGISQHEFERRSICKCGTGWPQVTRYPRKASTSMRYDTSLCEADLARRGS